MGKKHKKKNQAKFPWLFVIAGGMLLIFAAFFLAGRGEAGGGTPSIAVDQQMIDFGDVKLGVNKTFAIKVTNVGDGILRFKQAPTIQVVEGC